ncbi:DUF2637 domain-containing protein [Bifidobacterium longum]|uniref:DUF2637 domain-containing protein n=1 Tax=Bifidobacterium longum TaxID=216816 RepID=UPI000E4D253D|nr:DUF2637 domain-containing protein [Bifidobacterium longum]RHC69401.1 DUF2637 domain-containing protein [Bifidobacterium longum]
MNDKKTKEVDGRESVSMLPGVTVGVMIAVIAFVLSFDALRLVFVSSGINPLLSWGGPLCVDGTILLCTWATWGFRKGHIRGRWYPWAGLVLFSLFSVTGNALHAWLNAGGMLPTWGAPAIMSIPPIALLYSTHLIVIIAGDRQDKLARTTGKAAGPDDGHAGHAETMPETAGPEPGKATEPAPADPLDRYLFDPPAQAETDANRGKKEDPEDIPFDQDLTWPSVTSTTTTSARPTESTIHMVRMDQAHADQDLADQDRMGRKPEMDPKGQPGPEAGGHAGHAEPEPAESHEGTMSGPDRSSDTGSAHDAGPKAGEPARKTTAGFDPDEWLAWADKLKANGETVTSTRAVADGLAPSTTTAKRRLHTLRREHPGRF